MPRYADTYEAGVYSLDPLPGCDQVCVSHSMYMKENLRGKGGAYNFMTRRFEKMRELMYNCAIATVRDDNLPQVKTMEKYGWKKVHTFRSGKTISSVSIWVRDVEQ